jgi:glycosyltransferase involved in cell wall biosynthesis
LKKILLLTYYWPPSGGAGVQRWLKFTKYLPALGVQPIVITVNENKASYPVTDISLTNEVHPDLRVIKTNSFEPLNFYKMASGRKQIPFAGFANETKENWKHEISRFIRGNFFIPDARRGWNSAAFKACCQIIETEKIDTIVTTSPPHSTQLVGLKLKDKYGIKWVADIRDPWTDIYYYSKMNHTKIAAAIDKNYEKQVLENADKIVVVSEFIKALFVSKSEHIVADKIAVIPNGFDEDDFKNITVTPSSIFTMAYNGTLPDDYPVLPVIKAFANIVSNNPALDFKINFTGSVSQNMQHKIQDLIGARAHFYAHIPHHESIKKLVKSDVLLLAIPDVKNNEGILTGKLFEYLAAQKPIVCIGPINGNAATIINECKAGKVFEASHTKEIEAYLLLLITQYQIGH